MIWEYWFWLPKLPYWPNLLVAKKENARSHFTFFLCFWISIYAKFYHTCWRPKFKRGRGKFQPLLEGLRGIENGQKWRGKVCSCNLGVAMKRKENLREFWISRYSRWKFFSKWDMFQPLSMALPLKALNPHPQIIIKDLRGDNPKIMVWGIQCLRGQVNGFEVIWYV